MTDLGGALGRSEWRSGCRIEKIALYHRGSEKGEQFMRGNLEPRSL